MNDFIKQVEEEFKDNFVDEDFWRTLYNQEEPHIISPKEVKFFLTQKLKQCCQLVLSHAREEIERELKDHHFEERIHPAIEILCSNVFDRLEKENNKDSIGNGSAILHHTGNSHYLRDSCPDGICKSKENNKE